MTNKSAKKALIEIYGEECMFKKAKIVERIEAMGGIKTYKSYLATKRFKGKNIKKQLTYHHLKHKSEGGGATVENGAVVEATAHAYLHSLPRHQEEIINNMLRTYKINALTFNSKETEEYGTVESDMTEYITIPLEKDNAEYNKAKAVRERKRQEEKNRAKIKQQTQKEIEEYWERDLEDERL